jgi:predicted RNA-binding protein (virulence factor B family)
MLEIGKFNELVVESRVDFGLYLDSDDGRILLPGKYVSEDMKIGDTVRVFVYTDSEDRPVATTLKPNGVIDDFVFLGAKDVVAFGTFMDWGLEKDLLVPKGEQQDKMEVGKSYLTKVCFDESTGRVYGTTRISANCDKDISELKEGQKVELIIHSITTIGITAVINNRYYGMLYLNETYQELAPGDVVSAYIMRLRDDEKIDLTLKEPGYNSVKGSTEVILDILKEAGGSMPYHDKSSPEDIRKVFSMSKKEFKRALGGLFKKGVIDLLDDGIRFKQKWN